MSKESKKSSKKALATSLTALGLSAAMLAGTTLAWFTDVVTTNGNLIQTGDLKISASYSKPNLEIDETDTEHLYTLDFGDRNQLYFPEVTDTISTQTDIFEEVAWEPGKVGARLITVKNDGNVAAQVYLTLKDGQTGVIDATGEVNWEQSTVDMKDVIWFDVLEVTPGENGNIAETTVETIRRLDFAETSDEDFKLKDFNTYAETVKQAVYPSELTDLNDTVSFILLYGMDESADNSYKNKAFKATLEIRALQYAYEVDDFGKFYDKDATYEEDVADKEEQQPSDEEITDPDWAYGVFGSYISDYDSETTYIADGKVHVSAFDTEAWGTSNGDIYIPRYLKDEEGNTYLVEVDFTKLFQEADKEFEKITIGNVAIKGNTLSGAFKGLESLKELDLSRLNTRNVTDMSALFEKCEKLEKLDLSNFDTINVTDMSNMFKECAYLDSLDLSHFNTSNVTDMSGMFYYCYRLYTLDISNFNTSKVTDMSEMFKECVCLIELDVNSFNTSQVTNMSGMFEYCYMLNTLDVSNFNTSKVLNMSRMFSCCTQLEELDLSHFNTRKVTDMSYMFYWSNNLTKLNINQFNTSNVANMSSMFSMCRNLNSLIYRDEAITRSDFIAKLVPEGCKTDSLFDNCGLN